MKRLTLNEIIDIANTAYPDNHIRLNYNPTSPPATKNIHGDGLANFIVRELCDTHEPSASSKNQLIEAHRVMNMARRELESIESIFAERLGYATPYA
jgi:hypothetical protein